MLHKSELFYSFDVYGDGKPTATRNLPPDVDLRKFCGDFPVADTICNYMFTDPPFRRFDKAVIDNHIAMFRKVIENYKDLLPGDEHTIAPGNWFLSARKH
ncbi:hypothetical protein SDC9_209310 [bioreactor metagenome]|uniref:Uncharacterized protein n=1 Tax=bioreactor metagenome TaxID=1076179 RepID=A0A645JEG5_9ZZZZ